MSRRLAGKVCVVTGATGIGAAAARLFASHGASVFVISLEGSDCEALTAEIRAADGRCEWAQADLTNDEQATEAFTRCSAAFGEVDGLFAAAGGSGRQFGDGPIHESSARAWEETFRLNGDTSFNAARGAIASMMRKPPGIETPRGSVVIVSSVLAVRPAPEHFATHAYASVKGAQIAMAQSAAAYYAPFGIRVNVVLPGLVDTPMAARAAADPDIVSYASERQPLARGLLEASDIAAAGMFFLSDESSRVTGQALAVDGGWTVSDGSA